MKHKHIITILILLLAFCLLASSYGENPKDKTPYPDTYFTFPVNESSVK